MIPKVESYKTMRQNRMETREKLELLEQKPLQAIAEEEQRYVNLPPEKREIFPCPENILSGWSGWKEIPTENAEQIVALCGFLELCL